MARIVFSNPALAQQAPHLSPRLKVVKPPADKRSRVEFGTHWKELVLPVTALRIKVHNGMLSSIKNVVEGDEEYLDKFGQFTAGDRTSIFQLVRDEFMTRVEIDASDESMNAIRFHTNLRVSLWFGRVSHTVLQLTAPDGFYIHSLYGALSQCTSGHGVREIGAVFYPQPPLIARSLSPPPLFTKQSTIVSIDRRVENDFRVEFDVAEAEVGAIVVSTSPEIKWVRVVSRAQVRSLMELQHGIQPSATEQWVDLVPGERVVAVEATTDSGGVTALRFTTTHRTTKIGGAVAVANQQTTSFRCDSGMEICGFYGARGRRGITTFGVITRPAVVAEEMAMLPTMPRADSMESWEFPSF